MGELLLTCGQLASMALSRICGLFTDVLYIGERLGLGPAPLFQDCFFKPFGFPGQNVEMVVLKRLLYFF